MIYGKLPAVVLFALSFVVIATSGYQCSTRAINRGEIPLDTIPTGPQQPATNDYYYPEDYFKDDRNDNNNRLPEEVTDNCRRSQLRDLNSGARANFEFDRSSLQDFLFGQSQNFDVVCARLYLDMSRLGAVYKGSLAMAFQTNSHITPFTDFNSGYSASDNRYNKWSGSSWRADNNNKVNRQFHAIYEDEHSALILKLEDIRIRDVGDGEVDYVGAGEIYYKMFRIATRDDVKNTKGSCYSTGTYIKKAHTTPTAASKRCWFITSGPYSCRPEGALNPKDAWTNINITTNSYKCFSRLGRFWGLGIEEAFNDSVEDIN
ncbi:MAG: hypothetical protein OXJ52_07090 [Oligoflexia bacterium]|nr:hypothetical protein [Oligoflexia bacterium]